MAGSTFALDAPANLTVVVGVNTVDFDWDPVTGAVKYSVDLEGMVTFDYVDGNGILQTDQTLVVELSFGTSDRTDGRAMGDSDLTITKADLELALISAIQDALALPPGNLVAVSEFDGDAKVKALDPGKNKGRQNNPFSDPEEFSVDF
jgi:hypothetical protein